MKRYRLLIAWHLWPQLQALPSRRRQVLFQKFDRLEESPDLVSEFQTTDEKGRTLDCILFEQMAVYYWIDFADRQVTVLSIGPADAVGES